MALAIREAIQQAIQKLLAAVTFDGIPAANIRLGELPQGDTPVSPTPCVMIAPFGSTKTESVSGGAVNRIYPVEIALIDATQGIEATPGERPQYEAWHELTMNTIRVVASTGDARDKLTDVPSVWRIEIVDSPTFDREKLNKLYAYQSVVVEIHSNE